MLAGLVQHYQLRNPAGAVIWCRRVLRAVPTHYGAHYQLAIALLASGQERDARIAWNAFEPLAKAIGDRASLEGAPEVLRRPSARGPWLSRAVRTCTSRRPRRVRAFGP